MNYNFKELLEKDNKEEKKTSLELKKEKLIQKKVLFDDDIIFGELDNDNNDIQEIEISKLSEIQEQPFKLYEEDRLEELSEDIKINGLLSPLVVRKIEDEKYEILCGRNRFHACKKIGLQKIRCIIKDVDDINAQLILLNSNLNQREKLLPSEKAYAYSKQKELIRKLNISFKISEQRNIDRYIRLTYLIKELLNMIDEKTLTFRSGVNLSFFKKEEQKIIYEYMMSKNKILKEKEIDILREQFEDKDLTLQDLNDFFSKDITKKEEVFKLKNNEIKQYIPEQVEDKKQYIIEALKFYKENN